MNKFQLKKTTKKSRKLKRTRLLMGINQRTVKMNPAVVRIKICMMKMNRRVMRIQTTDGGIAILAEENYE